MFRLLRSRPNPFTLATRVHGSNGPMPQILRIQRVKIRRKWFKPRSFLIAGCIYYMCYRAYKASVFSTVSAWIDEQERHLTKEEREEMEEDMLEPMFFPIPFTTRAVPSPLYRRSDPEWQTFIRVNNDRALVQSVQDSLAELVRKTVAQAPLLTQKFGKEVFLSKYWLWVQYPNRPPPTFVQKGISIGDEIAIVEEPIDTTAAIWIQRALWPTAITLSLWSFSGALLKQNVLQFAKLFGYNPHPESASPSIQQTLENFQQRLKKPTNGSDSKADSPFPPAKPGEAGGSSRDSPSTVDSRSAESSPTPDSSTSPNSSVSRSISTFPAAEPDKPKSVRDIYGIENTQEHTRGAWMAFKQKFAQTWRPIQGLPPRGSILISGVVELQTSRAYITIDVYSFWDPKTEKFDLQTTTFRLRSIRMRQQSAAP